MKIPNVLQISGEFLVRLQ